MSKLINTLKRGARLRISLPFFSYEVNLDDLVDPTNVDKRISKLSEIKQDLEAAVLAVDSLRREAEDRKTEAIHLSRMVEQLNEERTTAEALLKIPEDSLTRLLTKASSRGRWRGILEGALVGFITGVLSSFVVWYFTR